ncbi:MAG: IclR family transcriptional regulator [Vulcanimicrobiaceae bacterium]
MRQSSLLGRAVDVVEYVVQTGRTVSVAELTRALDLPKPSAHRICATLAELRLLARDPRARGVTVGPRLARLALDALLASTEDGPRRRILRAVVEDAGETCTLTVIDGDRVLCLDRVESANPLQVQLYAGSHVPLHCTASGKLLLAFMAKAKRNKLLHAVALKPHTSNTIVTLPALEDELEKIRKAKVSTDNEEFFPGLAAVAVPIFNARRTVCAALSLNAPAARMHTSDAQKLSALQKGAEAMSAFLSS